MAAGDVPRVAELERAVFPDPWSEHAFGESLSREGVAGFVSERGGRITGYGICVVAADEGEILNLAVELAERRSGQGRALAAAMLDWMERHGAQRTYLEVRGSNAAAIALYRSLGFEAAGVRAGYYRKPREDALVMVRHRP